MKNRNAAAPTDLPTYACQTAQLAVRAALDDLTSVPELADLPPYRRFAEQVYLAARAAADLATFLGDDETARFTHKVADELCERAHL